MEVGEEEGWFAVVGRKQWEKGVRTAVSCAGAVVVESTAACDWSCSVDIVLSLV